MQPSGASRFQSIHFQDRGRSEEDWNKSSLRVLVKQKALTLRGDSPPTYTKSTSCRFIM